MVIYYGTHFYTSDKLQDMREAGELDMVQHVDLRLKMHFEDYRLYPNFLQFLFSTEEP